MTENTAKDSFIKHLAWFIFFVHLVLYLGINIILIISNFVNSPEFPWFIIPLSSWGLILFLHFLIMFITISGSADKWRDSKIKVLQDYENVFGLSMVDLQKKATAKLFAWMFFYCHLALFLGTSVIMLTINYFLKNNIDWSAIVCVGWSLWVVIHYIWTFVLFSDNKKMSAWRLEKLKKGCRKLDPENYKEANIKFLAWSGFNLHLFLFIFSNVFMIVIDLFLIPGPRRWFMYPLISWGLVIASHFIITYFIISEKYNK